MTSLYIVTRAMRKLGALDPGRPPTAYEAADGLDTLNQMIEAFALKKILVWGDTLTQVTFPSSKQSYTIGPGGDLTTDINGVAIPRPLQISRANIVLTSATPPIHMPCTMLDKIEYLGIAAPLVATNIPVRAYYDRGFVSTPGAAPALASAGLGRIYFNPYPSAPLPDFEFLTTVQVTQFADLTTDYAFAPGYAALLIYGLAEELEELAAPEVNVQRVRRLAAKYRRLVAGNNLAPPPRTGQDIGLGSMSDDRNADFNWINGQVM
jgi:hypothetical protein